MAAAHPDRGGSNEAFIAAGERYVAARREILRFPECILCGFGCLASSHYRHHDVENPASGAERMYMGNAAGPRSDEERRAA